MSINPGTSVAAGESPKFTRSRVDPLESLEKVYKEKKFADVWFSFGADNDATATDLIPAHKMLLAAESSVFEAMFYGDLKENNVIRMFDVTKSAFLEFLQFFYLNKVQLTAENITEVLYLGQKYNVTECIDTCNEFLKNSLDNDNVCTVLDHAIMYDDEELMKLCEQRIMINTAEIFQSKDFLECDRRVLEHILKQDFLSYPENFIFIACMAWVRAKSKEEILTKELVNVFFGDLIHEIRFKSMTIGEFCTLYAMYQPILKRDFIAITMIIGQTQMPTKFNTLPRQAKWNDAAVMKCNRVWGLMPEQIHPLDTEEDTIFSTNVPLFLGSIVCAKIVVGAQARNVLSSLPVQIEIIELENLIEVNGNVVAQMTAELRSKPTRIVLPHPVLIRPGNFYKISIGKFPEEYSYRSQDLQTMVHLGSNIIWKFHNDTVVTKNRFVGLISTLEFNEICNAYITHNY